MEIADIKRPLVQHVEHYSESLKGYELADFKYKKGNDIWSLCQLYDHLCISNAFFFMANTVRCLEERKGQLGGQLEIQGAWVLKHNSMSDGRFKGPSGSEQPCEGKDPREHYGSMLTEQLGQLNEIAARLEVGFNENYKCRHGRFGWMNALEWFQLLEIHLRHHLRQQKELEAFAAAATKA